jgi:hypothetical protein
MERHRGAEDDQRRGDLILAAVEELIEEASDSPLQEDKERLQGLLALRAVLLAAKRQNT